MQWVENGSAGKLNDKERERYDLAQEVGEDDDWERRRSMTSVANEWMRRGRQF